MPRPRRGLVPLFLCAALAAALVAALALAGRGGRSQAQSGAWLNFPGPGPGWVEVPHDPALNPTAAITLEAWVYLRSYEPLGTDKSGNCAGLAGKDFLEAYWLGVCNGRLRLIVRGDFKDSDAALPLFAWTHVAASYDGTTIALYINGDPAGDRTLDPGGPVTTSQDPLRIGHDVSWDATPDGLVDEVRLWQTARSEMQIESLMNTTVTTPLPGLVAAWNFDGDATDPVGGHNGTLHGSAGFTSAVPTPTPSPTPSPTPTAAPTPSPSPAPTPTAAPTPTPSPTPPPAPTPQKGDIDCNGTIESVDALLLLRRVAGLPVTLPEGCQPLAGG